MSEKIAMWLDDVRAAPFGWTHVRTVAEAKGLLVSGNVEWASLDHDLGICNTCTPGNIHEGANLVVVESLDAVCSKPCSCACHETGSDLVRWMAETGRWPATKPRVHSANPVGAAYMRGVIERYWSPPKPDERGG